MVLQKVTELTDEVLTSVQSLVRLLGEQKPIPTSDDLTRLIHSENSFLIVARFPDDNSPIVGMFSLAIYRVPTGGRAILEDLVVDTNYRNKGIARAMVQRAIEIAHSAGADVLSLTSNPSRVEANQLYITMGFTKRDTNSYLFNLK
jgi:ribosomal protein S18 acetylase RimI-like enzyme